MSKKNIINEEYLGISSQMYGVTPFSYTEGKAKGVRAFEMLNGSGIRMIVAQDRCLDITRLEYKGVNLSYLSKGGICAPEYFNANGFGFLKNFFVGFLTTCGLRNIGAPCSVNNEDFGLHGTISNTPAENVCTYNKNNTLYLSGIIRDSEIFKQNLILERTIEMPIGENFFIINNTIKNIGYKKEQIMFMLHINFGYPFLSPNTIISIPSDNIEPRDDQARLGFDKHNIVTPPITNYDEKVYFHSFNNNKSCNKMETINVQLTNPDCRIKIDLCFNKNDFPYLTQWNQFAKGDYVLGVEPSICKMIGRESAIKQKEEIFIKPGEAKSYNIIVKLSDI